ncbi:MAG: hypothetical protein QM532_00980 [Cyanobium sp. MAG06]|nr:hypothetical protein [Cyanobium sp. MAG06]
MINLNNINKVTIIEHFRYYVIGVTIAIIVIVFSFFIFTYITEEDNVRSSLNNIPVYNLPREMKDKVDLKDFNKNIEELLKNQVNDTRIKVEFIESTGYRRNPFLPDIKN